MANQRDIEFHYDLELQLFQRMLGKTMAYSCANWHGETNLDSAQIRKFDRLLGFAGVNESTRSLLDVGCGFGGTMRHAVERFPSIQHACGLTLSESQFNYCVEAGGSAALRFLKRDCFEFLAETRETFDAAVSIGAFEHFASSAMRAADGHIARYRDFFSLLRQRVSGKVGLQTIISNKGLKDFSAADRQHCVRALYFITKQIFPNSYLPNIGDIVRACSEHYEVSSVFVTFDDYIATLEAWKGKLEAAKSSVSPQLFERFHRYVSICIDQFGREAIGLAQFSLTPKPLLARQEGILPGPRAP